MPKLVAKNTERSIQKTVMATAVRNTKGSFRNKTTKRKQHSLHQLQTKSAGSTEVTHGASVTTTLQL
jgi:hypothetical protein